MPEPLRPLARRQAVEVRHAHFGKDAEALLARMDERRALLENLRRSVVRQKSSWLQRTLYAVWGAVVLVGLVFVVVIVIGSLVSPSSKHVGPAVPNINTLRAQ